MKETGSPGAKRIIIKLIIMIKKTKGTAWSSLAAMYRRNMLKLSHLNAWPLFANDKNCLKKKGRD
jgi:hypothetical protein